MDLSISIVSWNTSALLDQCLESILRCTVGVDFEVIVVDNASSDDTVQMLRDKYPDVRVLANTSNVGFAQANNQAYRISVGEFFLMLNPDTIVEPGSIDTLCDFLRNHADCGIVAPRLLWNDGSLQPSVGYFQSLGSELCDALYLTRVRGLVRPSCLIVPDDCTACVVDWASGACLMVRRSAILSDTHILDGRYFIFSEEADLCKSLAGMGWKVYFEPHAVITHLGSASTSQVMEKMLGRLYESKFLFFAKHNGQLVANVYRFIILPIHALVRILGYLPARVLHARIGDTACVNPLTQLRLLWNALGWRVPDSEIG